MRKIPNPRLRCSIGVSSGLPSREKPSPLSRISMVSSSSMKEQRTEKPLDRTARPCSTALLMASPAANRMSLTSSTEKPQMRANVAMAFRASGTLRRSPLNAAR